MNYIIETLIKILLVVLIFSALAGFTTYVERKILAFFQRRLGQRWWDLLGFCRF